MPYEPLGAEPRWTDRLGAVPNWVALAAVVVATVVAVHGVAHVLLAPESHVQASTRGVLIGLWGLTTLVAVGGLAALGGAHAALRGSAYAAPRGDLEILPEDERRIVEPILDTPGVTQVEVVARSGYSDAKVSQTLKALRERGLVYREPQGRTYRLYPGTLLGGTRDEY